MGSVSGVSGDRVGVSGDFRNKDSISGVLGKRVSVSGVFGNRGSLLAD